MFDENDKDALGEHKSISKCIEQWKDVSLFISRDPVFWEKPDRNCILRQALLQALEYAKNGEVPPLEILQVWELILKSE